MRTNTTNTNNRLYLNLAYTLAGITGIGGTAAVTSLIPDHKQVVQAQKIEALRSPDKLIENRTETEWRWITGEGKAWLKERHIDIEQAVKLLVKKNRGIDIDERSKIDPTEAEALMLTEYRKYEGPHCFKGPEQRGYSGPDEEGFNSYGTTYLMQLHDLEKKIMADPLLHNSMVKFISEPSVGSKYDDLNRYLRTGSNSFSKDLALSLSTVGGKSVANNPELSLTIAGKLNAAYGSLNNIRFEMQQESSKPAQANSVAALHAPRND